MTTSAREREPVWFVGAGPGDPELITVRGRRLLESAQVVVYAGSLVPRALVADLAAEVHDSAPLTLDEIVGLLADNWRAGRRVVRLHTGDPAIYGAIREQMGRLAELDIPCRVVPGVSSVAAAAASLSAELTVPEVSQTVIITRRSGRTPVPEREAIAELARHRATMMILLSVGMIEEVVAECIAGGYPPQTPAAVVEKASWPEERVVRASLAELPGAVRELGITKTAIICVGEAFGNAATSASRLYAGDFSHGARRAGANGGDRS